MSNRRLPSLSLRIRVAFLLLGLTAITLTSALAFRVAEDSLETATYERLTGIRETKRRQIEAHLLQAVSLVAALGKDESVIDALLGFEAAWPPSSAEYEAVRRLHGEGLEGLTAAMGFDDLLLIQDGTDRIKAAQLAAFIENLSGSIERDTRGWLAKARPPYAAEAQREVANFRHASQELHEALVANANQRELRQISDGLFESWRRVWGHITKCQTSERPSLAASAAQTTPALVELRTLLAR